MDGHELFRILCCNPLSPASTHISNPFDYIFEHESTILNHIVSFFFTYNHSLFIFFNIFQYVMIQ